MYKHKQVHAVFNQPSVNASLVRTRGRRFDRLLSLRLRHNEPSEGEGSACWAGDFGTVLAHYYF